jgi:hypothetical protein
MAQVHWQSEGKGPSGFIPQQKKELVLSAFMVTITLNPVSDYLQSRKSKISPLSAKNEKQPLMDSERSLALVTKQFKLTVNIETVSFSNK